MELINFIYVEKFFKKKLSQMLKLIANYGITNKEYQVEANSNEKII